MSSPDQDILLCELLAYRIIEGLDSKRSWDIGSNLAQRALLKKLAGELASNSRAITSIRRYSLKHLVWNPFTADRRHVGYIETANLIYQRFGIGQPIVEQKRIGTKTKAKSGCLGMVLLTVPLVISRAIVLW